MGDVENAFEQFFLAEEKSKNVNDAIAIANTNLGLADLLNALDRPKEALDRVLIAKEKADKMNNLDLTNRVLIDYGEVLYELNNFDEAVEVFLELVDNSKNSNQSKRFLYLLW